MGHPSAEDLVRATSGRADGLAITDHDEIAGARQAHELARKHPARNVDVVIGTETTTQAGRLLALHLGEPIGPGLPADRTIERIHARPSRLAAPASGGDGR